MNRWDIINSLIKKYNYETYLEVGTQFGLNFNQIQLPRDKKVCIDIQRALPQVDLDYEISSDDFFKQNTKKFDIIFIDGDHSYEQSYKDVINALKCLNENGTIVCHDCYPQTEDATRHDRMGTVYKTIIRLREEERHLDIKVVDTDCGCSVIRTDKQGCTTCDLPYLRESDLLFENYIKNPKFNLNLISVDQFKKWLEENKS